MRLRIRVRINLSFIIGTVGVSLILFAVGQYFWGEYREQQDRLDYTRQLEQVVEKPIVVERVKPTDGLGLLRIRRIGLEVLIRKGADSTALSQGAGWIPGTAPPGQHGNVGLAAHRDTF